MATDTRVDPLRSYQFDVVIEGAQVGGFSEVTGLSAKRQMVEYRNGNDVESHSRKLTGRDSFDNVTLKRGYTRDDTFWKWFASLSVGNDDRRNVTVTLRDEMRRPVLSWVLEGAWILSLMGPGMNAGGNEVAVESLELCVEKITMELEGAAA
jgi:phage tail-like protein